MGNVEKDLVYKYCSYDTFLKIIKNNEFYLNDVTKLNDKRELILYKNLLENTLNVFVNKQINNNKINDFYAKCMKTIEFWFGEENQTYKYFVSCFSSAKDSNLMWSRYGDADKGMCIGIEQNVFISLCNNGINYIPIKYIDDDEKMATDKNLDIYETLLGQLDTLYNEFLKTNSQNDNEYKTTAINDFIKYAFTYSVFYKSKWWSEEQEHRIGVWGEFAKSKNKMRLFEFDEAYAENNKCKIEDEKDITKCSTFHRILNFSGNKDIIKEVCIGPLCDVSTQYVNELLFSLGYNNVDVYKSKGAVK